ncbi:MAG: D-alanyl-lipoteichoic acid biosynthesis protein DltD [Terrimicrobiaceae bacterium]|nr:D-alanyl-lipoteichoic acid biosynthesis protein DltD [Terrimicrobiaceae bacterium]
MKSPSLLAACAAILFIIAVIGGVRAYALAKLDRHFDQLALANVKSSRLGLETDERVLERSDYLPVYGSCELVYPQHNRIDRFFASMPTGFRVAPSGDRGVTSLLIAERFAALGERLRGKRLIVILTPEWFFRPEANVPTYDGNFSVELALAALASPDLDPAIKQRLARRMADYPGSLAKNAFLSQFVAVNCEDSPTRHAVRPVVSWLATGFLGVQRVLDPVFTWVGFEHSLSHFHVDLPAPRPEQIDWQRDLAHGAKEFRQLSGDNPYGFRSTLWKKVERRPRAYLYKTNDRQFVQRLRASKEWEDYDLMLAVLHQYGAKPLIVSTPINARYFRALGTSPTAWQDYYGEVHKFAQKFGFPVVDFKSHQEDPEFFGFADPNPKGWIYINRAADAFYHGRLGSVRKTL